MLSYSSLPQQQQQHTSINDWLVERNLNKIHIFLCIPLFYDERISFRSSVMRKFKFMKVGIERFYLNGILLWLPLSDESKNFKWIFICVYFSSQRLFSSITWAWTRASRREETFSSRIWNFFVKNSISRFHTK